MKEKTGCSNLAYVYKQENNFASAYSYYVSSCNYGHAKACNDASMMIFNKKQGVPLDSKVAFTLALKGCELGNKISCANVAYAYRIAYGVTKSVTQAQKFYKKACKLGHSASCKNIVSNNQVATIK